MTENEEVLNTEEQIKAQLRAQKEKQKFLLWFILQFNFVFSVYKANMWAKGFL